MNESDLLELFSKDRLVGYKNQDEHKKNLLLIGDIAPKLGVIEVATRNKVAQILGINDSPFISHQTFGYWAKLINHHSIHNQILDLRSMDFRKYAKTNRKTKLKNFYKVRICFDLILRIYIRQTTVNHA